jgi:hypothetical protein
MDGRGPSRRAWGTAMQRAAHHILDGEPKILADAFARDLTGFASDQELLDELHRIRAADGRSSTFAFSALIWSNILGVVGMVAFSGFRSIAMINLAGV